MKHRRILVAVVALVLVAGFALLVGCSSSGSASSGTSGTGSSSSGSLDGKTVIQQKCGGCHSADQATKQVGSQQAATQLVDSMVAKGAQLTPEEKTAVIDYLAK